VCIFFGDFRTDFHKTFVYATSHHTIILPWNNSITGAPRNHLGLSGMLSDNKVCFIICQVATIFAKFLLFYSAKPLLYFSLTILFCFLLMFLVHPEYSTRYLDHLEMQRPLISLKLLNGQFKRGLM